MFKKQLKLLRKKSVKIGRRLLSLLAALNKFFQTEIYLRRIFAPFENEQSLKKQILSYLSGLYWRKANHKRALHLAIILFAILTPFLSNLNFPFYSWDSKGIIRINTAMAASEKAFGFPLKTYSISQGYWFYHPGWDLAAAYGESIFSIASGKIEFSGLMAGYGRTVIIDHGDGLKSLYAHMSKNEVEKGQEVEKGTVIGAVGLTGRTTGPHLHLEIFDFNKQVNPATFLSETGPNSQN